MTRARRVLFFRVARLLILALFLSASPVFAGLTQVSSVIGCGGRCASADGRLQVVHVAAQPGPVGVSWGGRFTHYAGFLRAYAILREAAGTMFGFF